MGQLPILITGASGNLGSIVSKRLAALGYKLRLSDIAPFPGTPPEGTTFVTADLADPVAVSGLCEGCRSIVHFGGINGEQPFDVVLPANLIGVTNIFAAALDRRLRVVYASSNHAIGFYPRGEIITAAAQFRPDGHYGISKAYGELLARMMFDKHGLESVSLRIGSCLPTPTEDRHLSTWLSYDDLIHLVVASLEAPKTEFSVVWGVSANKDRWWHGDDAARIGYLPQDDASIFAPLPTDPDPIANRFQGAVFCALGYSRSHREE